jgi:hypothetical protein
MKIEVCERLMDHGHAPEIKDGVFVGMRETPKYHAQVRGKPGFWGCGDTIQDAIGSLISAHPKQFGIKIAYIGKAPR